MAQRKGRCKKWSKPGRGGKRHCLKRLKGRSTRKRSTYRRRTARKAPGMARKGSHCRRMGRVYSRTLRKRVKRCVGGYSRRGRR